MRTLYISCLMFTSLISAMQDPASLATIRAKQYAITKQIEELKKKLGMTNSINIPLHEASTRIIGFGSTQKVIHSSTTPATSNQVLVSAAHERVASLYACPDRDIQIATTKGPRTILHTLKKVTRRGNLATVESHNTTPIDAPATTGLCAEKLQQINQLKSHSGTPPVQLCCWLEETDIRNSSAIPVKSSQETSGHVEPIIGFALAGTIATRVKPVLLDPQCFLYVCRK